jgi:hypothetical protein
MAEGVVVVLEAVEVEEREDERGFGGERLVQGARERAAGAPSPVNASVSTSSREARSIPTFCRKVSVSRIMTNTSAAAASATATATARALRSLREP